MMMAQSDLPEDEGTAHRANDGESAEAKAKNGQSTARAEQTTMTQHAEPVAAFILAR